jgi:hypothetical protein
MKTGIESSTWDGFAVIVGTDHHSLPSAVEEAWRIGVRVAIHAAHGAYGASGRPEPPQWGVISIYDGMWLLDARAISNSSPRRSPTLHLGDWHFVSNPSLVKGFDWRAHRHAEDTLSGCEEVAAVLWRQLERVPAGAQTVVPSMYPGMIAVERNGLVSIADARSCQEHDFQLVDFEDAHSGRRLLVSPGNCRYHHFCVVDAAAGTLRWHSCS